MPPVDDDAIWSAYKKGVKPIKKSPVSHPSKNTIGKTPSAKHAVSSAHEQKVHHKTAEPGFHAALDRNLERRLRQGDVAIEARLDLHGMRQKEAHAALGAFIEKQDKADRRNLLIITGKGKAGEGILRSSLAGWLAASSFAGRVLALRAAAARHGGAGAFYLVLRRKDKARFTE